MRANITITGGNIYLCDESTLAELVKKATGTSANEKQGSQVRAKQTSSQG